MPCINDLKAWLPSELQEVMSAALGYVGMSGNLGQYKVNKQALVSAALSAALGGGVGGSGGLAALKAVLDIPPGRDELPSISLPDLKALAEPQLSQLDAMRSKINEYLALVPGCSVELQNLGDTVSSGVGMVQDSAEMAVAAVQGRIDELNENIAAFPGIQTDANNLKTIWDGI